MGHLSVAGIGSFYALHLLSMPVESLYSQQDFKIPYQYNFLESPKFFGLKLPFLQPQKGTFLKYNQHLICPSHKKNSSQNYSH
jgi:hypothetical protein